MSKNILLLDDEEMILNSSGSLLEVLGHNVYKALTGEEAIEIVKNNLNSENKIDIAILDIFIPNSIGGAKCNKIIKEIDSSIYSVIVSGDSANETILNYEKYGFDFALSKPYSFDDIKEMLNKSDE